MTPPTTVKDKIKKKKQCVTSVKKKVVCGREVFKNDVRVKCVHTHTQTLPLALCSMFFQLSQAKEALYSLSRRK